MNDHLTWWFQPTPLKNDGVRHLGLYIYKIIYIYIYIIPN